MSLLKHSSRLSFTSATSAVVALVSRSALIASISGYARACGRPHSGHSSRAQSIACSLLLPAPLALLGLPPAPGMVRFGIPGLRVFVHLLFRACCGQCELSPMSVSTRECLHPVSSLALKICCARSNQQKLGQESSLRIGSGQFQNGSGQCENGPKLPHLGRGRARQCAIDAKTWNIIAGI